MNSEQLRSIVSAVAILAVTIASIMGWQLDLSDTTAGFMAVAEVAVVAWSVWKNHNFTAAACYGQLVLDALKQGILTDEEVDALLSTTEAKHAAR